MPKAEIRETILLEKEMILKLLANIPMLVQIIASVFMMESWLISIS